MPLQKIMERSGGPKEATDVWVIRFWNFKTVYSAAALKIVMVSIVEGREEVLLQAGDLSTISTISDPHETERQ